eukprot:TRINITY_DN30302_c0_g1_i3.p2 TRINITY_DN30302_c0_g1~~TRINITY_DN30302_c0_g1_i3.p2  ORF type:complete len:107 (-),score=7.81 TRINITY_DN30302_c0_g1_i3:176-496(-)
MNAGPKGITFHRFGWYQCLGWHINLTSLLLARRRCGSLVAEIMAPATSRRYIAKQHAERGTRLVQYLNSNQSLGRERIAKICLGIMEATGVDTNVRREVEEGNGEC